ncbi:unnamed protein product [Boreogadus saida]
MMMYDHTMGVSLGLHHRKPSRVESAKRMWRVSETLGGEDTGGEASVQVVECGAQAQMSPSEMWASDRASEPMLNAPVVSRLRRLLLALPPHGNEQGGDLILKASTTTTSVMKAI